MLGISRSQKGRITMDSLEMVQKTIDDCNRKLGCYEFCTKEDQEKCSLRQLHRELVSLEVNTDEE